MQKNLIFISGTIGSGKTTLSNKLVYSIPNSVMLDGDWGFQQGKTWYFDKETKNMAIDNIIYTLNNYIKNPHFENIIFCWTLHKQKMIYKILDGLKLEDNINFYHFSLICSLEVLKKRITERNIKRSQQLNMPVNQNKIEEEIIGSWEKTKFYLTNDAIKLDGDEDLNILYHSIINTIDIKKDKKVAKK